MSNKHYELKGIQACQWLARGLSIKETAAQLKMSRYAVSDQIERVRRKYRCLTTYQLLVYLTQQNKIKIEI